MKDSRTLLDLDPLLASSRKALLSLTEVKVHRTWSEFYVASARGGLINLDFDEWYSRLEPFLFSVAQLLKTYAILTHRCKTLLICCRCRDVALSFLGFRHMLHAIQSNVHHAGEIRGDESVLVEPRMLINVVHHLMNMLASHLDSAVSGNIPIAAIDWDTFEALLGKDGKESEWSARLFDLSMTESPRGTYMYRLLDEGHSEDYGMRLREEIEIVRGRVSVAKSGMPLTIPFSPFFRRFSHIPILNVWPHFPTFANSMVESGSRRFTRITDGAGVEVQAHALLEPEEVGLPY